MGGYAALNREQEGQALDAMRDLEKKGVIGKLADWFYTTAGVMTTLENGKKFGRGIAELLKKDGVDAVILTST